MEAIGEGRVMASKKQYDDLRTLIPLLLSMISDKAESIHLRKKDYELVKSSPAAFGLSLSNTKDIVAVKDGRMIIVKSVE